jgi:hypothetical protein
MPRKKIEVTPELRQKVQKLSGIGLSQRQISYLVGIQSLNTLRKYFRAELERGPMEALASVQQSAFRLATSGRNPAMTISWLKRRARWGPDLLSRSEDAKPRNIIWSISEYQPPAEDGGRSRALIEEWARGSERPEWDGDCPARADEDD